MKRARSKKKEKTFEEETENLSEKVTKKAEYERFVTKIENASEAETSDKAESAGQMTEDFMDISNFIREAAKAYMKPKKA